MTSSLAALEASRLEGRRGSSKTRQKRLSGCSGCAEGVHRQLKSTGLLKQSGRALPKIFWNIEVAQMERSGRCPIHSLLVVSEHEKFQKLALCSCKTHCRLWHLSPPHLLAEASCCCHFSTFKRMPLTFLISDADSSLLLTILTCWRGGGDYTLA